MKTELFDKGKKMNMLIVTMLFWQGFPSVENWEIITQTHYEVKNTIKLENESVLVISMIGSFKILKNPELLDEFVFVVSKYPPLTFMPQPNQALENTRDEMIVAESYFQKIKQEKLKKRLEISDVILFIKWRESKDQKTGEKILLGSIENWLRSPGGKWIFKENAKPAVKIELLSEDEVLIGFKFSLEENYHILRFDQSHLGSEK